MTISSALNNAMSGLRAAGRTTDVIAMNIANATTPGYARRTLEVSSTSGNLIGGVTVNGVIRHNDPALLGARREAQAGLGFASTTHSYMNRLETVLGTPDDPGALTNRIADFDAALLSAASRPDAPERHEAAIMAAKDIVQVINDTSKEITAMRTEADSEINAQVTRLNAALKEVEHLNTQIAKVNISGEDDSALLDMRQQVISEINEMVPVREAARDHGKVALYSTGGVVLLQDAAVEIEFSPTRYVEPDDTPGSPLSGLSINGQALRTGSEDGQLPGGTLAAQFAIRDELGPDAMAQIDAAARDLVERFQSTSVDPTLAAGDAGLFTDDGAAFAAANEIGLAERLTVNAVVDPAQGGDAWKLRDGLGAATPGAVGQSAQIENLRDALAERRVPASGDFGTASMSYSDLANSMLSRVGVQRLQTEQSLSFASASYYEMSQAELAAGVDTDQELQNMMLAEQAYAANAQMIKTLEEIFDILMSIGR